MKRLILFTVSFLLCIVTFSQVASGDAQLDKRLNDYMQLNREMNFNKMMDYMHPKLFTLAPRAALVKAMKDAFSSPEMSISISDLSISNVSNTFTLKGTEFRKVGYYMKLSIRFTDTAAFNDPEFLELMQLSYEAGFPGKTIVLDRTTHTFHVSGEDILIAIREPGKPWLFLGHKNDPALVRKMFAKEVITHFDL